MRHYTIVFAAILEVCCMPGNVSAVEVNVALGATATQSGTLGDNEATYGAQNAVDGWFQTFNHTADPPLSDTQFLEIDLGSAMDLTRIDFVNAMQALASRLNNAVVSVLDAGHSPIFSSAPVTGADTTAVYTYDNGGAGFTGAHYIRVDDTETMDPGQNYLHLVEVLAWQDQPTPAYGNLAALLGTASQSSLLSPWYAAGPEFDALAFGPQNGIDSMNSIAHTNAGDLAPSYEVDLSGTYQVDEINLISRADGASPWYNNLTFQVFDESGNEVYNSGVINPWDGMGDAPLVDAGTVVSPTLPGDGVVGSRVVVTRDGEYFAASEFQIIGPTTVVPEPSTVILLGISAVAGLASAGRRCGVDRPAT